MRAMVLIVLMGALVLLTGCEPKPSGEPVSSATATYEVTNVFPRVQLRVALKNLDTGEALGEVYVQGYRSSCTIGKWLIGAKHTLTVTTYKHASGLLFHRIDNSRPLCEGRFL